MRAGLSTIQQTLTPEAASILNHSISEARKRNHGQTTPLHVAATLLASPSGYLRQACIRSHPNSSHPLQSRALELCFSVALERLPSAQGLGPGSEPPISNALMAALKRAQAHQRRGCPEQQQQPLLAVKVELEQLIVSILDDPSVSRVMREASFSSPAVKAIIEQSLNSSQVSSISLASSGLGFRLGNPQSILRTLSRTQTKHFENGIGRDDAGSRPLVTPNRNLYLNPRLQVAAAGSCDQSGQRREEVKKVIDILSRRKKRNPVLVGDTEPDAVVRELLLRIEKKEVAEGFKTAQVVSVEKELASVCVEDGDKAQIAMKFNELGSLVKSRISGGIILNLGNLKWLVEQPVAKAGTSEFGISSPGPVQQAISEVGQLVVAEMGRLLDRHGDSGRLWLIGTATCETYLRCQVYHPSMEKDWDLQALPIAARSPLPGLFSRLGGNGILSSSAESLTPSMGFPPRQASEKADSIRRMNCCPMCMENYEQELAKLVTKESEKSSSDARPEAQQQQQSLPQWLQITKPNNGIKETDQYQSKDQEQIWKQKAEELQKKWNDSCYRLHPGFHSHTNSDRSPALPNPTFDSRSTGNCYGSNPLLKQPFQPKLRLNRSNSTLQSTQNSTTKQLEQPVTPPASPVRTELILGRTKTSAETLQERLKDSTGCIPCEQQKPIQQFSDNFSSTHHFSDNTHQFSGKTSGLLDADSFKRLFKGLTERVGWQPEAASAVATTVMECRSGTGKRRGVGLKSDTWLLFLGLDKVGKRKMVMALSELVFANKPVWVRLGSQAGNQTGNCEEETSLHSRGKTVLDRIAEHVRRNPFSVIVLEDFDQADLLIHKSLKRAMEKGRLPDSHGREISLGSVIFALTANWLPEKFRKLPISFRFSEEKLEAAAASGWPLQLSVNTRVAANNKRRAEWLIEADDDQLQKPRKDLPVAAAAQPTLSIDLNLTAEDNEPVEVSHGSRDSSEITVEPGLKCFRSTDQLLRDVLDSVDNTVVFKPVDFNSLKQKIVDVIAGKFSGVIGDETALEIDEEALEQIMGGVWFGRGFESFEEWVDRVLVPGFRELKSSFPVTDVRMVSVKSAVTDCRAGGDLLPSKITVVTQ